MKNNAFIMTDEVGDEKIDNLVRDLLNCPACRTCKRENKKLGCRAELQREAADLLKTWKKRPAGQA